MSDNEPVEVREKQTSNGNNGYNLKACLFLGSVTGASLLFGFGMTLAAAKKRDPKFFGKGLAPLKEAKESGGTLAMRALGWGTLYSISGFSLFCFLTWKSLGVHNLQEFREKMQSIMPTVPKNASQGRSEFNSLTDLLQYIIDEDDKNKKS